MYSLCISMVDRSVVILTDRVEVVMMLFRMVFAAASNNQPSRFAVTLSEDSFFKGVEVELGLGQGLRFAGGARSA